MVGCMMMTRCRTVWEPRLHCTRQHARLKVAASQAQGVVSRCPFADFSISKPTGTRKPTPLDLTDSPTTVPAYYWLAAGRSGQDVPGKLVSGLSRLYEQGHFLLPDPQLLAHELQLKDEAFVSRRQAVWVAEEGSLPAQQECLELFLEVLPNHFPDLYTVRGVGNDRHVMITFPDGNSTSYAVAEFTACPLELCGRLVQEDLVLLRVADEPGPSPQEAKHAMSAACVVFSFQGLQERLSATMLRIHAPVPGFEQDLDKLLARTFTALQADKPIWRNNWGVAFTGDITVPSYNVGLPAAQLAAAGGKRPAAQDLWLKTEYQTLRRLPRTGAILFTIKTMLEPMATIGPAAAKTLHKSLSGMKPELRAYKGLTGQAAEELLDLLEGMLEPLAEPSGPA